MSTLKVEHHPQAQNVKCTDVAVCVELLDGRTISATLDWFQKLARAKKKQLENWQLLGDSEGLHWPETDEDLSVAGLLAGKHLHLRSTSTLSSRVFLMASAARSAKSQNHNTCTIYGTGYTCSIYCTYQGILL